MEYNWQFHIALGVILYAVSYAVWRIIKAYKRDGDTCDCCETKKNCQKFGGSK